jgi:hypothetical protein
VTFVPFQTVPLKARFEMGQLSGLVLLVHKAFEESCFPP